MDGAAALRVAAGRRGALALLSLAVVCSMSTWFSATAVVPQLRDEWTLGDDAAAWLTIAVQLGFVAGALASSAVNLTDVVDPRRVFLAGAAGAAAANALLVAADGPETAIPLRFATGAFLAGVYPPAIKLVSTWWRAGRGIALGILVGALTLGSALPHLVNGLGGLDWHVVVWTTSALTLAGGVLVAVAVAEGPFPFPPGSLDPRQLGRVLRNRGVRLASLGYFGHMWELFAMWAWIGVFLREEAVGARAAAYGAFGAIAIGALGCLAAGIVSDRWGRPEATSLALGISGTCALLVGPAALVSPALAVAVALLWGLAVVADSAQFSAVVTEEADQAYVGTALALQLALGFTLTVATIWLVPLVADEVGWTWAFAILAPGPALGIAAMLRLRRPA